MRIAFLCVAVCVVAVFTGFQAESRDLSAAERGFLKADEMIVEPFAEETELFETETAEANMAQAFSEVDFKGAARNQGTPLVIRGHNDIASLKVPSGQCAALFTKAGFNGAAAGEMLKIRGPINVPSLEAYQLQGGQSNWREATHSYKMGPCTVEPEEDLATAAIKAAAASKPDLSSISHVAQGVARGQFGSIVHSFTHADKNDGVAHSYAETRLPVTLQTGQVVSTNEVDPETAAAAAQAAQMKPYPYAEHKLAQETAGMMHVTVGGAGSAYSSGTPDTTPAEPAIPGGGLKIDLPFPRKVSPIPFHKGNRPADDMEDLRKMTGKNSLGCDKDLGCGSGPPPCQDSSDLEMCQDYLARGDCQFDFAQRECKESCGLCPKDQGAISSDAHLGPNGHYYIGSARRRIGAGFGRRRRTPVPKPYVSGAPPPPKKVTVKTEVSILHPDGKKTVEEKPPPENDMKPCETYCVPAFKRLGGCKMWGSHVDPTSIVPKGCMHCGEAAAKACGIITDEFKKKEEEEKKLPPQPIEHPNEAAKVAAKEEKNDAKEASKGIPKAVVEAAKKLVPPTTAPTAAPPPPAGGEPAPAPAPASATTKAPAEEGGKTATAYSSAAPAPAPVTAPVGETAAEAIANVKEATTEAVETSKKAADKQDAAASKAVAAEQAVTTVINSVDTKAEKAATTVADIANSESTKATNEAASEQTKAVTAEAHADESVKQAEAVGGKIPSPPPPPKPTEDEIIKGNAENWAAEQIKKEEDETGSGSVLVQEDESIDFNEEPEDFEEDVNEDSPMELEE
jgi:hypothetical protein